MVNLDYLYNNNDAEINRLFNVERLVNKKLGFKVIENGMILPIKSFSGKVAGLRGVHGGIIDNNQKFVSSSFVTFRTDASYPIPPAPESIMHRSETVVYLGMFYPVWGHVLTDDICFLWFLKSDEYKSHFKDCPLVYIPWSRTSETVNANFKRLLEILEINPESFKPITQPTQFAKIIVPDRSFSRIPRDMGKLFTNEYRDTIDRIRTFALKNRTPTTSKKIYYFYGSKQFGEERLAEYFRSKGYDIVRPERLTVDEQLNLLINCESFASTLGSVSHNALFLRDNSETILIPRAAFHSMYYQLAVDQVHPLNVNYVDSSLSLFYRNTGPNCFIISKQLKKFFGDKFDGYEKEDFQNFLQYVKTSLSKGREVDLDIRKYYSTILPDFLAQLKRHKDLIKAYKMPPNWEKSLECTEL